MRNAPRHKPTVTHHTIHTAHRKPCAPLARRRTHTDACTRSHTPAGCIQSPTCEPWVPVAGSLFDWLGVAVPVPGGDARGSRWGLVVRCGCQSAALARRGGPPAVIAARARARLRTRTAHAHVPGRSRAGLRLQPGLIIAQSMPTVNAEGSPPIRRRRKKKTRLTDDLSDATLLTRSSTIRPSYRAGLYPLASCS